MKFQADDGIEGRHEELIQLANSLGLMTAVTIRNEISIKYRKVDYLKIGSGECLNDSLVRVALDDGRRVIVSTGGTTESELRKILSYRAFAPIIVCECVSSYPNHPSEIRLGVLRDNFVIKGYSDHMQSYHMSLAAIALGVEYIEKHISLDPMREDANHSSSISPSAFREMVRQGKEIYVALENSKKVVQQREISTGRLTEYRRKYLPLWGTAA
ncbi:MAG: N-acetylneuraminate synthase family protein [Rubrobacteraceae bacterium]